MSVFSRDKFDEDGDRPVTPITFDATLTEYQMVRGDRVLECYGNGDATLPMRSDAAGLVYCVIAIDGNVNVIEPETATTKALTGGYDSFLLFCDGSNWLEITNTVWAAP